jgi:hypothetical protein
MKTLVLRNVKYSLKIQSCIITKLQVFLKIKDSFLTKWEKFLLREMNTLVTEAISIDA